MKLEKLEGAKVEFLADKGDKAPAKRFSILAYTGAKVARYYGDLAIELKGITMPEDGKVPILSGHDDRRPVGYADKATLTDKGLVLEGSLVSTAAAQEIAQLASEGYPWKASIGINLDQSEELADGAEGTVNGYTLRGPATIARKCSLFETSFLTCNPADKRTAAQVLREETRMDEKELLEKNPELAKKLRGEGAEAFQARLAEFLKAIPKRKRALKAALSGKTIEEAKLEYEQSRAKKLEKKSEKAELKAKKEAKKAEKLAAKTSEEEAKKKAVLEKLKSDSNHPGLGFSGNEREGGSVQRFDHLPPDERAKAEWQQSPTIRECFKTEKHYAAYLKAESVMSPKDLETIDRAARDLLTNSVSGR